MRSPILHLLLALLASAAGCAKAEFVPVSDATASDGDARDARQASDTGDTSDTRPGPEAGPTCSAPSVLGCAPATADPCDPVCQTGGCDWCNQKCSYAYATDNRGPVPVCASAGAKTVPESCTVSFEGTPQQSDDCATGRICLPAMIGDTQRYCFFLCSSPVNCPYGVDCGPRPLSPAGGVVRVCDPPYDQCGPDGTCCDPMADTGCDANRHCLLVAPDLGSGHSRTVCEYAYGDGRNGSPCTSARDCQTRHTCVNGSCLPVCDDGHPCAGSGACAPLGAEYGYCP